MKLVSEWRVATGYYCSPYNLTPAHRPAAERANWLRRYCRNRLAGWSNRHLAEGRLWWLNRAIQRWRW